MKERIFTLLVFSLICISAVPGQVPIGVSIQMLKAEDARRYDTSLEKLLSDTNPVVRKRAALAAGRIGDERAITNLVPLLEKDASDDVRAMAAFALGEIESVKGADAILDALGRPKNSPTNAGGSAPSSAVRARLVEAAGKIAAANSKDEKAKALGEAILRVLTNEEGKTDSKVVRLGLTAALRARPAGADEVVRKFLAYTDPDIVGDALNTLTRLRAKNANRDARDLLATSVYGVVRANAARVLGAAEDKDAAGVLLKAAVSDNDLRVRVSAIRALGGLKGAGAGDKLLDRGEALYKQLATDASALRPGMPAAKPVQYRGERNELLEIATTLGRLFEGTKDEMAVSFMTRLRGLTMAESPEVEIAFARIAPKKYVDSFEPTSDWKSLSAQYQGLAELAKLDAMKEPDAKLKARLIFVQEIAMRFTPSDPKDTVARARPELVRSFAAFKSENTSNIFRPLLESEPDVFVRAAIAETLGEQSPSNENAEALRNALRYALDNDKQYNDGQLAIMEALAKTAGRNSIADLSLATHSPDYLVRIKAVDLLNQFPGWSDVVLTGAALEKWRLNTLTVRPYASTSKTKLGQVLNTDADYRRALSRKNGMVKAVLSTEKGTFTIDLMPEDAPLTVDNFIKLARANYFNGVEVHRVVPNFVMQDGDPHGDGNGGPGWSIRCEINMLPYERGVVGMALSGKDTGGSQWFVTHSPQPHLDGGYTVFGRVTAGMNVVDSIVRGDVVKSISIR